MFKKFNRLCVDVVQVLELLLTFRDKLDDVFVKLDRVLDFIRVINDRFGEFDEFRRESIEFLKSDDERFKDADK